MVFILMLVCLLIVIGLFYMFYLWGKDILESPDYDDDITK